MSERAPTKQLPPTTEDSVREHRRAVEETVEALKTKISRATDRVEHARERVDDATDYLRAHRWPALGAAVMLGLFIGARRRHRAAPIQLMLPSGLAGEVVHEQKKKTLISAALGALGTMLLREVGMRAVALLEDKLLKVSNPPEPPIR